MITTSDHQRGPSNEQNVFRFKEGELMYKTNMIMTLISVTRKQILLFCFRYYYQSPVWLMVKTKPASHVWGLLESFILWVHDNYINSLCDKQQDVCEQYHLIWSTCSDVSSLQGRNISRAAQDCEAHEGQAKQKSLTPHAHQQALNVHLSYCKMVNAECVCVCVCVWWRQGAEQHWGFQSLITYWISFFL